jgi:23S rRNA (uracil1939-C5)-methyltransferase
MVTPGQILVLTIEKPAAGGRMIARADGQIVLVGGAIPGESVRARVERVGKGVAYAETLEVESASADRRDVFADLQCGGCLYGHIAYPRQLDIKSQVIGDAFQRIGRLPLRAPVRVAASPEDGYRMRARLHVRGHRIGFFREGTHEVCDPRQTRQLLPATCDALDRVGAALQALAIDGVREVELAENADGSERVVFLDAAAEIDGRAVERLADLEGVTGVVTAFASRGAAHVTDRLTVGGVTVSLRRHVLAFFQGNRHLLPALTAHVVDQVPASGEVLDLYAGVGVFAVSAALARGVRVTAVEGDRVAAADLAANASAAGTSLMAVHQAVEDFVRRTPPVSTAIVDPPRTGMSRDALNGVVRLHAARVIYVSCDVATLARDARRLVDAGYEIERIDAFDLFPNTPHVETVVVFDAINVWSARPRETLRTTDGTRPS